MHNFRKVVFSALCIVLIFAVLSAIVIIPYLNSEMGYYQDHKLLDTMAGSIDVIAIGASNGLCAFNTAILDDALKVNSYNLSGTLMTLNAREFLLHKEVERNPIKTVIFDISYEMFTRDETQEYAQGDAVTITKLSNICDKIRFICECISFEDYVNLYAQLFAPGIEYWVGKILGDSISEVEYEKKGFYAREQKDITLNEEQASSLHNSDILDTNFKIENILKLADMIEFCKKQNIQVILATVPRSNAELWTTQGHDVFYQWMNEFSKQYECVYFDFNLLRNRYDIFDDKASFYDTSHMSSSGADTFTKAFCDILKKAEVEDVSQYFYDSYEEMEEDSPYMKYLP